MRHVVGLSGGKDSVTLALRLQERGEQDYEFLCTPTGDELPEMFALGRYVIHLQQRLSTVSAILDAVKSKYPQGLGEVPWNDFENRLLQNSGTGLIAAEQHRVLQSAIGSQTPDSALIKKLHEQFLQEI